MLIEKLDTGREVNATHLEEIEDKLIDVEFELEKWFKKEIVKHSQFDAKQINKMFDFDRNKMMKLATTWKHD